jgi:hypothetical protein
MAQKDSKVNLQLAATTTTIARESKKDSSAMKAIAVLTMCFLPGTFLAVCTAGPRPLNLLLPFILIFWIRVEN